MTHWEASNLMTDYLEGTLETAQKSLLDEHLAACPECRAMAQDLRFAVETLHSAEEVEPAPWLMARILQATTGARERQSRSWFPSWLRLVLRPQVAYGVSMAVFSLSFIFYTSNVNLRGVKFHDLNPITWVYRADSRGHLLMARAEKFYYDLRFVYEVQSLLRQVRQQPGSTPAPQQKRQTPGGGASGVQSPEAQQLALEQTPVMPLLASHGKRSGLREK